MEEQSKFNPCAYSDSANRYHSLLLRAEDNVLTPTTLKVFSDLFLEHWSGNFARDSSEVGTMNKSASAGNVESARASGEDQRRSWS